MAAPPTRSYLGKTTDRNRISLSGVSWALFEGARNPYIILVLIYIFMPYFTTVLVGNPIRGQALMAEFLQWTGITVAATAPLLGASVDRLGRRKRWLAMVVVAMVPLQVALWWARPDHSGLSVHQVLLITSVITLLFTYSEVLHNSMLVSAAGREHVHVASGLALALGNVFSVCALLFVLWAFVLPGNVDWPLVPAHSLFGLQAARHEPDRIVGPLTAVLLAVGSLPLFLFARDTPAISNSVSRAVQEGAYAIAKMLRDARGHRNSITFLLSRMIYVDGVTGFMLFGGVYAAGVMHWGPLDMLAYGLVISIVAIAGGLLAAWMDGLLGPRRTLQIALSGMFLCVIGQVGMAPDRVLFFWTSAADRLHPLWHGPVFHTLPDAVFVLVGAASALFLPCTYASSRTLLTRITPPERTGAFFGLYSLAGNATAWLAPAFVRLATEAFKSQQAGFAPIAALLLLGLCGLLFVRDE